MDDSDPSRDGPPVSERDLAEAKVAVRNGVRLGLFSIFGLLFLAAFLMLATGAFGSPVATVGSGSSVGAAFALALLATALVVLVRWSSRG